MKLFDDTENVKLYKLYRDIQPHTRCEDIKNTKYLHSSDQILMLGGGTSISNYICLINRMIINNRMNFKIRIQSQINVTPSYMTQMYIVFYSLLLLIFDTRNTINDTYDIFIYNENWVPYISYILCIFVISVV